MIEIEPQTIPQSEDYTGVPAELARDWIARNFITVEKPAGGRGSKNMLAIRDLYKVKCFGYSRTKTYWEYQMNMNQR